MPRGGHRGGIFPVSGLPWGPGQRYLKRGLYRHQRTDVFVPRWGWRRESFNPSPLPDGSTKKWEAESSKAWPLRGLPHHVKMYACNEERYLQPLFRCTYTPALQYLTQMLEHSEASGRCYSGLGRVEQMTPGADSSRRCSGVLPANLIRVAIQIEREGNANDIQLVRLPFLERGRIRRLWDITLEADTWRAPTPGVSSDFGASGALPIVDERAAVVRELPLAECLYARSNHRLNSRRHPIWVHFRYIKDKSRIPYLHRRRLAREKLHADTIGALKA